MQIGEVVTHNGGKAVVVSKQEQKPGMFGIKFQMVTFRAMDDAQKPWSINEGDEYTVNCVFGKASR